MSYTSRDSILEQRRSMKYDIIIVGAGAGGFDNLYVADASVMPNCPRANIHLTSIMIGERMADWLRGRA